MRIPHILLLSSLTVALVAPQATQAQSIVAADDGGYAGQVIEKVGRGWVPPAGLHGHFAVRIKVTVDQNGKVSSCKPVESSELKAFDDAACGAVYNAAPFGRTPDGKPVDVHMAFRIGAPKKAKRELTFEEAAREGAKERERLNNLMASQEADFAASRARERAEEAAKKLGIDMPDIQPRAVDPTGRPDEPAIGSGKRGASGTTPPRTSVAANSNKSNDGVLIGSSKGSGSAKSQGPELVIKSNLKHLDDKLEAQSMATAEAQAQAEADAVNVVAPPSATRTQTSSVTERELPGTNEALEAKAPSKIIITSRVPQEKGLTSEELALPPLITMITAVDETLEKIEQHNRNVEAKNSASTDSKDTPAPVTVRVINTQKPDVPAAAPKQADKATTPVKPDSAVKVADKAAKAEPAAPVAAPKQADKATTPAKPDSAVKVADKKDTKATDKTDARADTKKDGKKDDKKESNADKQPVVVTSVTPATSKTPAATASPTEKPEKKVRETPAPKADKQAEVPAAKAEPTAPAATSKQADKVAMPAKPDNAVKVTDKAEKTEPAAPVAAPKQADKTEKADTAPQKAPAAEQDKTAPADMSYVEYVECIKQEIQKKIALPAKLNSERIILSVQLYLSKSGRIRRADLIHSNHIIRDTQLAEAVKQVGKVTAPPAALGQHFPLTLVLEAK